VSSILVALFDFLMTFLLFVPLLFFYRQPGAWVAILLWPVALFLSLVATLGPGCLLAALNVKYRDFRYVIPFLVQILFFLTPVIYPVSLITHPVLQYLLASSPMYAAVELFRYPLSGAELNLSLMMVSLSSGIVLVVIGLIYFKRTEDFFADLA
jgi:lipopolysaccharide transport system permease protein